MSKMEFSNQQKEQMIRKLQTYFENELDHELGQFDGEFLLDFLSNELGGYYYNRGLHDARAIFENRVQSIDEDIYAIEKDLN